MSKTLSNGVLSLRFMQNAQRAKQLKEVELQRAEVVDEGKWEVSQAVREAWGLTKERNEDQDADVHEASYLPFLHPIADEGTSEDPPQMTSGRRVFKHTILDVHDGGGELEPTQRTDDPAPDDSSKPSKGRIHAHPRPISLASLSKGKGSLLKGFDQLSGSGHDESRRRKPKDQEMRTPRPTAREMIFESGNVGIDLRDQASAKATPPLFIKPAGVDDPKKLAEAGASAAKISPEVGAQVIDGARQRSKKTKRERDQDDEEGAVKKKSKKKKKKSAG